MSAETAISPKEAFVESLKTSVLPGTVDESLCRQGLEALDRLEFPTSKTETWKYTRVGKIIGERFSFAKGGNVAVDDAIGADSHLLIFRNGFFDAASSRILSETEGVRISCLSESIGAGESEISLMGKILEEGETKDIFPALNAAFHQDGLFLSVSQGLSLKHPIEVVFIQDGAQTVSMPRNLIVMAPGSKAEVLIRVCSGSSDKQLVCGVTEINAEQGALLNLYNCCFDANGLHVIWNSESHIGADAVVNTFVFSARSSWARFNASARLNGRGGECGLYGSYFLQEEEHCDHRTVVDHKVPDCLSNELYKGIVSDRATGVFNGKVFVRKDAQRTNAYQRNANLVMSDGASMNSKPELEIYADDVKCSHGSTTGQLDEEAMFYLRSRGLSEHESAMLLIRAFLSEVTGKINNDALRGFIEKQLGIAADTQ
jgi:Fe-S cluster assembly protein SufD